MRAPYFVQLARLDDQHFISACRHGLVHLTWGRATIRFSRDEFRQMARLLQQAVDGLSLIGRGAPVPSIQEGDLRLACRFDGGCELQVGSLGLRLSPNEFQEFARVVPEAIRHLDEILASRLWEQESEEPQASFLEQLRRTLFSRN